MDYFYLLKINIIKLCVIIKKVTLKLYSILLRINIYLKVFSNKVFFIYCKSKRKDLTLKFLLHKINLLNSCMYILVCKKLYKMFNKKGFKKLFE